MVEKLKNIYMILFAVFFTITLVSRLYLEKGYIYPFKLEVSPINEYIILDLSFIITGARKLGADIAWIQLLQYYGTEEEEFNITKEEEIEKIYGKKTHHHHHHCRHNGGGVYPDFLKHVKRVISLDPYFYYVYLYGAASLAWNLNRPDEGIFVLDEGLKNKNDYWQFVLYKQAIIYKKLDRFKEMIYELEKIISIEGCPVMVKAILANIYKKAGEYEKSLNIWMKIVESGNKEYIDLAKRQIQILSKLIQDNLQSMK